EVENTKYVFRDCAVTKELWQKLDFVWPPLDREKLPSRGQEIERWRLLEGSNLKINFDVAFNKQENTSCSRIMVRDSNGGVLGSKTVLNRNVPSAFAAEALACAQVVQMGLEIYLSTVEVEGDSLSICWFKHTPRMANMVAHAVATEGLKRGEHIYLRRGVLEYVAVSLENDRRWIRSLN
ncbi:hypothetical protein Godav_020849, partial [Gossypium davidsonii]|nr:hypothetical protein [Gossypium davidsonii]